MRGYASVCEDAIISQAHRCGVNRGVNKVI